MIGKDRASLPNTSSASSQPRHRWFQVKEAFSPHLLDEVLEQEVNDGHALILDPFCGSGTIPVSAALLGRPCTAFEVNPFLHFVASTKLTQCSPKAFECGLENVLQAVPKPVVSPLEGFSTFTEREKLNAWLFNMPVLRAFEAGWQAASVTAKSCRSVLKLALLEAAMLNCNAKRDGKCVRYRDGWKELEFDANSFEGSLVLIARRIAEDLKNCPIRSDQISIVKGDVRKKLSEWDGTFSHCVTSPPYLNSFDYNDIYRPELFLGKFVNSTEELRKYRLAAVRSHVQANWKLPVREDFGYLYRSVVSELRDQDQLWDKRIPTMVQAYFEDMNALVERLGEKAKKSASLWIVVSTSAYAGIEIPVDLILAELATRQGWRLKDIAVLRDLRSSSQYYAKSGKSEKKALLLRESAVILKRP